MGHYHGEPTTNRLLIEAEFMDAATARRSCSWIRERRCRRFSPPARLRFIPAVGRFDGLQQRTEWNRHSLSHITIKIGTTIVNDLDVVKSRRGVAFDAVGLLPAFIFQRIYISHTGGFVVLNPALS
jgi:hypothetical protein